jgi:hypothetical protein
MTIEEAYNNKSNDTLICSKSISLSNEATNDVNKKIDNKIVNDNFSRVNEYNISHLCLRCKKLSQIVCSNCKIATYCSRDCQQNHWQEKHYTTCKTI